jgi:alanine-glyoxylate transaminase/serine-glyoxylate transaminase/serine-pyruvate transaminase
MKNLVDSIPHVLLLGAGPSCVAPATYQALAQHTLSHMDPYFIEIMDGIKAFLQQLMNTKNQLTVPLSTSGSGGMEAAFVNVIEPGDQVLVIENGIFSDRFEDVASRIGGKVDVLHFPWGSPIDLDQISDQLGKKHYQVVSMVYAETSTGVKNPVWEVGEMLKGSDSLFLVDAVPALGGIPLLVDDWHIDICYSGSQKCLSCPPGLAPITFSEQAVEIIRNRKTKVANWYLDMNMILGYWGGGSRVYHHTAPVNMLYGLYQALYNIFEEGVDNVFARHLRAHHYLIEKLAELGLELFVEEPYRLEVVNAIRIPQGFTAAEIKSRLLNDYHIEIGGGYGSLDGKIVRVGLMGYNAQTANVDILADALHDILKK